jgi:mannose/fructose/N-acetylgalactosamine-specific phosphotransferase system component IIB
MISLPWRRKRPVYPIVRIDDRLLHGQVVVGWGQQLGLEWIILASDRVAESPTMVAAMKAGAPLDIHADVFDLEETVRRLGSGEIAAKKSMLVFESPGDLLKLIHKGVSIKQIHIGGLHFREGAEELLPYVYLSNWDRMALDEMTKRGIRVTCQDLPGNHPLVYR